MKSKFFYIWISILIIGLSSYFLYPQFFTETHITNFLKSFNHYILPAYIIIFILRSFTLIPNTPFVIAGTLLFPESPFLILLISVFCIMLSSFIIYNFSEFLGFDKFFQNKYPDKIEKVKNKLNNRNGIIFIILWSFLPFAPTDLICYAAGILRIRISIFLLGIFLGELPICYFYIYSLKQGMYIFS